MKKLLISTALIAAATIPALAQDGMFRNEMTAGAVRASDLIGARVYASEAAIDADEYAGVQEGWNDIGEINDVIVSRDGNVDSVLVDIGGFLGMGENQVAVDMAALRFVSDGATTDNADDWFLVMNADRVTLEGAPKWSMGTDEAMSTQNDQAENETDVKAVDAVADDGSANDQAENETDVKAVDAVADDGSAADGTVGTGTMRDGYSPFANAELTADMLKGTTVYDANDEVVGEVGELILADDGQIKEVIIDVGGFLGMGEKPVALQLEQLEILRQNDGSDLRVYVATTKEQLEAMPDYEM